ncbi:MAG: 4-alpha-glucanotransferase [Desulfomonile tiedjei]|nr:4-alpha-glucanotransferase [Desulfomonile tiedjei]
MSTFYETLKILGDAYGIEAQYTDNWGKIHWTDPSIGRQILELKGIPLSPDLAAIDPQVMVVSADAPPEKACIYLEGKIGTDDLLKLTGHVTAKDSSGRVPDLHFGIPDDCVVLDVDEATNLLTVSLPFPQDLPLGEHRLELVCTLGDERFRAECLWIVCPGNAYLPRTLGEGNRISGVAIALYGVRSRTNWGVGDFADLKKIIDWARYDLGAAVVGLNPLHALFNKRPFHSSPYLPSSRLFRNFIYLDLPVILDFTRSTAAVKMVNSAKMRERIARLRSEEQVNYEGVAELKLEVLRVVFRTFLETECPRESGDAAVKQAGPRPSTVLSRKGSGRKAGSRLVTAGRDGDLLESNPVSGRWAAFRSYCETEGDYLDRFATFCALMEHFRSALPDATTWKQWPEAFQSWSSDEIAAFRRQHQEQILFWMYVQWQLDVQLKGVQDYALEKGMLLGLYHDEALAVDRNGADCWAWPEFFHHGFTVGAPPDAFAPDGQDWGFPPPNRDRHRCTGYRLFRKQMQANCAHAGALRIDHVMQLCHLFWIPPGGKPKDGVYVKDYEQDLLNLLCLESELGKTMIIGEDLGTIPGHFRERLMEKGILSYRLFYFERDREENLLHSGAYPESAVVSIATHDLPTLVGFWSGRDIRVRREIGQLDEQTEREFEESRVRHKAKIIERLVQDGFLPEDVAHAAWESSVPTDELHSAILRFIFATRSRLAVVSQEDIFLDARQQNVPGTTSAHPNWVTKMRYSVEELRTDPEARRFSEKFSRLSAEAGRSAY